MHIAIGYRWFETAAGYHLERALTELGHQVTYVGLPCPTRAGYGSSVSIGDVIRSWPDPPDMYLWVDPAGRYFPPGIEDLSIPTACYLIDVHLGTWRVDVARFFDAVFLAQKPYVEPFRQALGHSRVYWLPLAAAPDVHRAWNLPRVFDVGFVGNLALAHRGTGRERRLQQLAARYRTNDFYRFYPPEEVGRIYSQSRLVFNCSIAGDVTMRVFEGSACGALVVTDPAHGLDDLFELDREMIVYHDEIELASKIDYYLSHEAEWAAAAAAGQKRTLSEHTYVHRMRDLIDVMTDPEFKPAAPMRCAPPEERWQARQRVYTHLHMVDAILDGAKTAGQGPLRRLWSALPALLRVIRV